MASNWSDDDSTIEYPSRGSIKLEVNTVFQNLRYERSTSRTALVAVVRPESSDDLQRVCDSSAWNKWKFWRGKPLVLVTTLEDLKETVRSIRDDKKYDNLTIAVSGAIDEISFRVHSGIRALKIVHCEFDDIDCNDYLFVDGASTLAGVRLDEWGTELRKKRSQKHAVLLGKHVKIRVDPNSNRAWAKSASDISGSDRRRLKRHIDKVEDYSRGGSTWKDCRGAVSALAGIAVGTSKLVVGLKGMAGGVAFQLQTPLWGVKAAAFGLKTSAFASVAGPAILLGAATAAAVYFIPWKSFWNWLKGFMAWLWQKTVEFWDWFCSCVRDIFVPDSGGMPSSSHPRMRHSGLRV